jgi:hypothetical protein
MTQVIGLPRITARIPALQMKAEAASITVIRTAALVTHPRYTTRHVPPVTMAMAVAVVVMIK